MNLYQTWAHTIEFKVNNTKQKHDELCVIYTSLFYDHKNVYLFKSWMFIDLQPLNLSTILLHFSRHSSRRSSRQFRVSIKTFPMEKKVNLWIHWEMDVRTHLIVHLVQDNAVKIQTEFKTNNKTMANTFMDPPSPVKRLTF